MVLFGEVIERSRRGQGTHSQEHRLLGADSESLQPTAAQQADKFRTFMLLSAIAPRVGRAAFP